jgi:hypothetical protein
MATQTVERGSDMSEEMFQGLAVDLTTVLEKRNKELDAAKHVIGGLLVALAVPSVDKYKAQKAGTDWLKIYNDRVHPKKGAPHG